MNFYNEIDPKAAAWLRELIAAKEIPPGVVDERSITELEPDELKKYTQCHFFAGIAGWSLALKLAGWPATRPVWTGSCPCQPFSSAGKQLGAADERHLWPAFFRLIRECRPVTVIGEQVANAIGKGWLDGVSADLEREGYACGAVVLGAHSVGAPHIRQRLYWVADASGARWEGRAADTRGLDGAAEPAEREQQLERHGDVVGLADAEHAGQHRTVGDAAEPGGNGAHDGVSVGDGGACWLGSPSQPGLEGQSGHGDDGGEPGRLDQEPAGPTAAAGAIGGVDDVKADRRQHCEAVARGDGAGDKPAQPGRVAGDRCGDVRVGHADGTGPLAGQPATEADRHGSAAVADGGNNFWSDAVWLACLDGKARRVKSTIFPLADGVPGRVGLLRGAGNAIVPECAEAFIRAYQEGLTDLTPPRYERTNDTDAES